MNFLTRLKIGPRLALAFATLVALMLITIAVGFMRLNDVNDVAQQLIIEDVVKLNSALSISALTRGNASRVLEATLTPDAQAQQRVFAIIDKQRQDVDAELATLDKLLQLPEGKALLAEVVATRTRYVTSANESLALVRGDQQDAARTKVVEETLPLLEPLRTAIDKLVTLERQVIETSGRDIEASHHAGQTWMAALGAVAVVTALTLGVLIARSITVPMQQALDAAERVAAGNLRRDIAATGHDEISRLLAAMQTMQLSLRRIVGQVRSGVESVSTASAQIAVGNADLSQRTEEQAANLEQTAASMEELTTTVQHNTDTARQASQMAQAASAAAAQGGQVVADVVTTMGQISENSRRIGDIIGVIDGIAFQTNILALNAAVEAARAGEQGRGFAVVASEVRSLAQRSADAAREIKSLIGASVDRVETGSNQVSEAGRAIENIIGQVGRVNDLVGEISTASIEQSRGIGQIGEAVAQLDRVTQQNAALVEESAAAAESLKDQANRLVQTVAVFEMT